MKRKDRKITVMVSENMLKKFTQKCNEIEVTKSEVIRRCIINFISKK